MPNDPLIVQTLEARAKNNARGEITGRAIEGTVMVHYYPVCGRFSWFAKGEGAISKSRAVDLLTKGLWKPTMHAAVAR